HLLFGTEPSDPGYVQKWAERVHRDDWATVQQCMEESYRSGKMDFDYRYWHPEQGLLWFYCKGRRFSDGTRMVGIVQDITERKQAEEVLQEKEQRINADLAAMQLLHEAGMQCTRTGCDF